MYSFFFSLRVRVLVDYGWIFHFLLLNYTLVVCEGEVKQQLIKSMEV